MTKNNSKFTARVSAMKEGVRTRLPANTRLVFGGKSMEGAAVTQELDALSAAFEEAESAKVAYAKALGKRRKLEPIGRELVKGVTSALLAICGDDPVQLAQFGLTLPKSKHKLTAAQKAEAVEKASATRKLKEQGTATDSESTGQTNGTSH